MDFLAHWHDEYELFFALGGQQSLGINNRLLNLTSGQIGLVAPWDIHYYEHSGPAEGYMLIFSPDVLDRRLSVTSGRWTLAAGPGRAELAGLLDQLCREMNRQDLHYDLAASGLLRLILARILRPDPALSFEPAGAAHAGGFRTMQAILTYLEEHYTEPLSRELLAGQFKLSPSHLSRHFKAATGLTFSEYLSRLRLENACQAIRKSSRPIIDIAFSSGFDSIRTFNRSFQRFVGCSPSGLRRKE